MKDHSRACIDCLTGTSGASGLPVHPERTCTLRGAEGQDLVEYQGIPHRAKRSGHKLL